MWDASNSEVWRVLGIHQRTQSVLAEQRPKHPISLTRGLQTPEQPRISTCLVNWLTHQGGVHASCSSKDPRAAPCALARCRPPANCVQRFTCLKDVRRVYGSSGASFRVQCSQCHCHHGVVQKAKSSRRYYSITTHDLLGYKSTRRGLQLPMCRCSRPLFPR